MQETNQFPKCVAELNQDMSTATYIKGNRVSHNSSIPLFTKNVKLYFKLTVMRVYKLTIKS